MIKLKGMEVVMRKFLFVILFCVVFLFGCSNQNDTMVNYVQAKEQIINNGAILIDVRTQEEYDDGHIEGAVLLSLDTIDDASVSSVVDSKDTPIIVYCKSGKRSHEALEKLNSLGYQKVYDLGAMSNWRE